VLSCRRSSVHAEREAMAPRGGEDPMRKSRSVEQKIVAILLEADQAAIAEVAKKPAAHRSCLPRCGQPAPSVGTPR